jgi:hypothetical protein
MAVFAGFPHRSIHQERAIASSERGLVETSTFLAAKHFLYLGRAALCSRNSAMATTDKSKRTEFGRGSLAY